MSSTVGLTSCVKPTRPSDPQNIIYGLQKEAVTPPEDPPADTQSESVSVSCTQQSIVENSQSSLSTPAVVATAATTGADVLSAPLTVFSWYCKWNVATRGQLLGVVQAVTDWVALENVYREKLTVVNMRDMSEDDVSSVYFRIKIHLIFLSLSVRVYGRERRADSSVDYGGRVHATLMLQWGRDFGA